MTVIVHEDVVQGSTEWAAMRCGLLTASEMHLLVTPTLKIAANEKERAHVAELTAQRITQFVEPTYVGDDMLRGLDDELEVNKLYAKKYAPLESVGFITNDKFGFIIGYSPDAKLVGKNAGIETKSRRQKFQIETICTLAMPVDYVIQVQTGLMVSEWEWIDFNSYCGGLPMVTIRIYPDAVVQEAIVNAATVAEESIAAKIARYQESLASTKARLIPTERRIIEEIY